MDKPTALHDKMRCTVRAYCIPVDQDAASGYGLTIWRTSSCASSPLGSQRGFRYFEFYGLSHLLKGRAVLKLPGKPDSYFEAGQAVLLSPGVIHNYYGVGGPYTEDAICFGGPIADHLHSRGQPVGPNHLWPHRGLVRPSRRANGYLWP